MCESRPSISDAFLNFLNKITNQVDALYILGDLFEYWIGDDSKQHENIIRAIKALTGRHIKVFLMHGNRDFLIGPVFEKKTGALLLKDLTLIKIYGRKILLSHGDSLCTDDIEYQSFKNKVRNESWKNEFLKKPLTERIHIANEFRKQSELNKNQDKIIWYMLSINPNAIKLLEANREKIDWNELSRNTNPEAIELLKANPDKINWFWLSGNPAIFDEILE